MGLLADCGGEVDGVGVGVGFCVCVGVGVALEAVGEAYGFGTSRMESYEIRGVRVSSTLIRQARGDLDEAEKLLGLQESQGNQQGKNLRVPAIRDGMGVCNTSDGNRPQCSSNYHGAEVPETEVTL